VRPATAGRIASTSPYAKPFARLSAGIFNMEAEIDQALAAVSSLFG